jgi:phospholipid transport system substrate-binding protein
MASIVGRAAQAALVLCTLSLLPLTTPLPAWAADAPAATPAAGSPDAVIKTFTDGLIGVMKQATQLGYDGRYKTLDPLILKAFDIPFMTKIVVGAPWASWTQQQRDSITAAFGKFITSTYARRFDGYSGESFTLDGTQSSGTGTVVMSRLMRPSDTPVTINYLLHKNQAGQWQVVDVFLTGSISELATRRSEFSAVLDRDGYSGLLTTLQAKSTDDGGSD